MMFSLTNLPYWMFLGTGILLFLFVIFSGGGDDDMDVDADVDADIDLDADLEIDGDVNINADIDLDGGTDGEAFSPIQVLAWVGIGRTPLILLVAIDLTVWGFGGWFLNVAIWESLARPPAGWIAASIFLGSLAFAVFVGSMLSRPIGRIFAAFGEDASSDRLIGCLGTVTSASIPFEHVGKIGQVDVKDAAANLVTISAKLPDWATITLRRGAKVLVIERSGGHYLVIAHNSPDQDRWFSGNYSA
ncbi:MAG: YqiJ family protein [Leptolyngbya sp. SIO1D8]|nr:YqiJ family protein [Leptolyngbya sp. SIO1D8]